MLYKIMQVVRAHLFDNFFSCNTLGAPAQHVHAMHDHALRVHN
jgi:hypothetical protein